MARGRNAQAGGGGSLRSLPRADRVPEIGEVELSHLASAIRPLVEKDGLPWEIEPVTGEALRRRAYTWAPAFVAPAGEMVEVARLETIHTYGAPSLFKPSVAEVIAQIPESLRPRVEAFVQRRDGASPIVIDGQGYHVVETVLFGAPGERREVAGIEIDQVSETRRGGSAARS